MLSSFNLPFPPLLNAPRLVVATAPAEEPVTLAEIKAHLHIDSDADDAVLTGLLAAARGVLEEITSRSFVQTKWTAYLDHWPRVGTYMSAAHSREIELPKAPLLAVAGTAVESVKYLDKNGTEQTLAPANYNVAAGLSANWFGRLRLNPDASIPTLGHFPGALRVTFYAGYGAAAAVPEEIKVLIKLLAANLHNNPVPVVNDLRVNDVPYTLRFLIENLTVRAVA
ncbi:MAG: head-tail connector protein [Sphingomonadales bacterium]|nr:head-tail connector protein [Sphingomonadales bacterium]